MNHFWEPGCRLRSLQESDETEKLRESEFILLYLATGVDASKKETSKKPCHILL